MANRIVVKKVNQKKINLPSKYRDFSHDMFSFDSLKPIDDVTDFFKPQE